MFNKRGISDVVATVLIILVTVAAATIVWITVIPMIQNKMAGSTDCLSALSQVEIGVAEGYTCYRNVGSTLDPDYQVDVQVKMKPGDAVIPTIDFLVSMGGTTSTTALASASPATLPGDNEETVFTLGGFTSAAPTAVAIAPYVQTGQQVKACAPINAVPISVCP